MNDYPCELCGTPIRPQPGKPGRPRRFCEDDCYQAHKVIARLGILLERVVPRMKAADMGPVRASRLRRRLFGMCNALNAVGKPVKLVDPDPATDSPVAAANG